MDSIPTHRNEPPAIEGRALVKTYGPIPALDGVDLRVRAGESLLLVGPNGAGKSTLLRILATLSRPTSGTLLIHGRETRGTDLIPVRRGLGLLTHQTFLYDHLTALENLVFYARLYDLRDPGGVARDALRTAGLDARRSELVKGFSRGMQQRLGIARAMLHRPDILLLDEPFTGLDREAADRLLEMLSDPRDSGRTCVMTSHDFPAGIAFATRVIVLVGGRAVVDRPSRGLDAQGLDAIFREATRSGPVNVGAG